MIRWLVIAICVVAVVYPSSRDEAEVNPEPSSADLFDTFASDYRVLLADGWDEFASTDCDSDDAALEWLNQRNKLAHQAAFSPVHERAAAAADQGPEFAAKFADDLRGGNLR